MPGMGYVVIHEVNQHQAIEQWVETKSEFLLSCIFTINFPEFKVQGLCTNNPKTFCQIDGAKKSGMTLESFWLHCSASSMHEQGEF